MARHTNIHPSTNRMRQRLRIRQNGKVEYWREVLKALMRMCDHLLDRVVQNIMVIMLAKAIIIRKLTSKS
jgi:hypothetical protein